MDASPNCNGKYDKDRDNDDEKDKDKDVGCPNYDDPGWGLWW